MFKWLSSRDEKASNFLQEVTGTPAAVVQQVCDWLEDQLKTQADTPALLLQAQERLDPVLDEMAAALHAQRLTTAGPRLLRGHYERLARLHAQAFARLSADDPQAVRVAVRTAQLFCRASRLARKSYEDPGNWRGEMAAFLAQAHQRGALLQKITLQKGAPETSVAQEYGMTFLWDTAPFDALTLEQIEYLERFMSFFASRVILKAAPGATAPYAVLADGRVLAPGQADPGPALLYVGPGPLLGLLAAVQQMADKEGLPNWAGEPLPHTGLQTLKGLAERLCSTWERKRIKRGSERVARQDGVRVAGGFENMRRAIAYSAYVRSGGKLRTYITHSKILNERSRDVMVGIEGDGKSHTPLETLTAMEAAGDKQAIESWTATDSSGTGYSLVVPGFRAWLGVGGLLAVREDNRIDWQVGIVRRLYNASAGRCAGIEILAGKALPAGIANGSVSGKVELPDLRDAIVIRRDTATWLITPFPCQTGSDYVLASHEGQQRITISERYMEHADYTVSVITSAAGTL